MLAKYWLILLGTFLILEIETGAKENIGQRITFTVSETVGIDRKNVPVRISGKTLFRQSVKPGSDIRSIRLLDISNKEVPFQIIERDKTGLYVISPNNCLDSDDEFIFQIDLAPHQKKTYYLEFNPAYTSLPEFGTGEVTFKEIMISPSKPYHVMLSNPYLSTGIQGQEEKLYNGIGQGCITYLRQGKKRLVAGNPGCFWGPTQKMVTWMGKPKLVTQGPVRTTVMLETTSMNTEFKRQGGAWTVTEPTRGHLKGKIFRYYHLYHGLPYLECEEVYQIKKISRIFRSSFVFSFRTEPVVASQREDQLYVPLEDGDIATVKLEDKQFCGTEYPFDGWLGITGEHNHLGLSVFFDCDKAVNVYGGVIRGYLRKKYIEKPWLTSDLAVTYELKDIGSQKTATNRLGLYVLNNQNGKEIRNLYRSLWKTPPMIIWKK